jgi:hypothetical protein
MAKTAVTKPKPAAEVATVPTQSPNRTVIG